MEKSSEKQRKLVNTRKQLASLHVPLNDSFFEPLFFRLVFLAWPFLNPF